MSEVSTLTIRLCVCIALSSAVACAPPTGTRSGLSACDGGACADAAPTPPCVGEACAPPPPGERPDGPYLCAPGVMCEAWQDCLDGVCTGEPPLDECVESADCARGERCLAGRCTAEEPGCVADADCGPGSSCVDGACLDVDGCAADADCAAGERCLAGVCGTPTTPGGCSADSDCAGGETCVAGTCTPASGGGGGCLEDEHCH